MEYRTPFRDSEARAIQGLPAMNTKDSVQFENGDGAVRAIDVDTGLEGEGENREEALMSLIEAIKRVSRLMEEEKLSAKTSLSEESVARIRQSEHDFLNGDYSPIEEA